MIWVGFLPFWTVCGVLTASLHPFLSQHRADTATHHVGCETKRVWHERVKPIDHASREYPRTSTICTSEALDW